MAIEHKVAFVPGEEFHLSGQGKNTMRLNFSNASPDRIEERVKRQAAVMAPPLVSELPCPNTRSV